MTKTITIQEHARKKSDDNVLTEDIDNYVIS